jgi:hypothetical protein
VDNALVASTILESEGLSKPEMDAQGGAAGAGTGLGAQNPKDEAEPHPAGVSSSQDKPEEANSRAEKGSGVAAPLKA